MSAHIAELTRDVEAAQQLYSPDATWNVESVGNFMQAVLQGSFIFAKAEQSPEVIRQTWIICGEPCMRCFRRASTQLQRRERHQTASDSIAKKEEHDQTTDQPETEEPEEHDTQHSHFTD